MAVATANTLRLGLSVKSQPGAGLIDWETRAQPAIFTAGDLTIAFAVFDEFGVIVDLSNITYVEADFVDNPEDGNILASASLPASALTAVIPILNWRNGTQDQGGLSFSADALSALFGRATWLVIHALTTAGEHIFWGAGWVSVKRAGVPAVVKMPLAPVPSIIPLGAVYEIPAGVTITFPTSPQILGSIVCDPASNGLPPGNYVITSP